MGESSETFIALSKLPRKEQIVIRALANGAKRWAAAKLAGYKAKSKKSLAETAKRIQEKYESRADKDELYAVVGLTPFRWAIGTARAMRYAWAKKDAKVWHQLNTKAGEAIGVLKSKDVDIDRGATIVIETSKAGAKKIEAEQRRIASGGAKVFNFPDEGD